MRVRLSPTVLVALALLCPPAAANAQVGVAAHAGSLGIGADVGIGVSELLGVRVGINIQPWAVNATIGDVRVQGVPATPALTAFVDLHPGGSGFRLTGGAVYFASSHTLSGQPLGSVEFGGRSYDASVVGSVNATLQTRALAPYVGIGWGGAGRGGLGVSFDLGVAFQGEPGVSVAVDGPIAIDADFQAALNREVGRFQDDISLFHMYPVLAVGVSLSGR